MKTKNRPLSFMEVSTIDMKKKYSKTRRKCLKKILIPVVIQVIIILLFCEMLDMSRTIDIKDTKQLTVTVDAIRFDIGLFEDKVCIKSNSEQYIFGTNCTSNEYAIHEIFESISQGDEITIIFHEVDSIFGPQNWILDARTETEVFRTYEDYLKSKTNIIPVVCALFSFVELLFLSGVFFFTFPFDRYSKWKREKDNRQQKGKKTEGGSLS